MQKGKRRKISIDIRRRPGMKKDSCEKKLLKNE
jgi:hypothetical protein